MEGPLLRDEQEYPSEAVLARHLAKAKPAWDAFTARLAAEFSDAVLEWRFYKDGKAWLGKLVRKKKTVCWVSIWSRAFRTTFYFTGKSRDEIERLPISQELKQAFRAKTASGKLSPMTVDVRSKKALGDVFTLLGYKAAAK